MEILRLGNELLHQKAQPVKQIGPEQQKIAADLLKALHDGKGIGLAGPQIGIMERIFVIHIEGGAPHVFINPSIIETSQELAKYEEGCLSIPGFYADIVRPVKIKVQAWNEAGRPFTLEVSGLPARVILHEYDHLDGILFIDRLPEEKKKRYMAKLERISSRKNKSAPENKSNA